MLQRQVTDLAIDPRSVDRDRLMVRADRGDDGGHGDVVHRNPRDLRKDRLFPRLVPGGGPDRMITVEPWTAQAFQTASTNGTLKISPEFQRRDVWAPKDQMLLIDPVARGVRDRLTTPPFGATDAGTVPVSRTRRRPAWALRADRHL